MGRFTSSSIFWGIVLILLQVQVNSSEGSLLPPIHLTCEYLNDPLGVQESNPRLAWYVQGDRRGSRQTAYQILVATSLDRLNQDSADVWDSGKVISEESIQIPYAGKAMSSGQRVYWKVRTWDDRDAVTDYSQPAFWQMGFLAREDWKAQWIGTPEELPSPSPAPLLRHTLSLPSGVRQASVSVSALGLYELFINGQRVGENILAPEWTNYQKRIQYQTYDVTRLLQSGENVVGAMLGEGWYAGTVGLLGKRQYGNRLALIMQMDIECQDGSRHQWMTGPEWKCSLNGPVRSTDIIVGEEYDGRKSMPGWNRPGFDDSHWDPVALIENQVALVSQPNQPIQITREIAAQSVKECSPGVFVFDLGQNMVGWSRCKVHGKPGDRIVLRHVEVLNPDGTIYTENLRGKFQIDTYILEGKENEILEPHFTYHGFRYVEVDGLSYVPSTEDLQGMVFHSHAPSVSRFECSDPMLNQLMKNIVWTLRGNLHSTPTDCPQRDERLGWMGDAQIFSQAAIFTLDMAAFFTKWTQDIRDAQASDGRFSDFSPNPSLKDGKFLGAPAWADAGIIVPWRIYENYGDTRILEKHYESAKAWVAYVHRNSPQGLWSEGRGNDYGDWLNGDTLILEGWPKKGSEMDHTAVATAFAAHSADLVARMAEVLGKSSEVIQYRQWFEEYKKSFQQNYIKSDGLMVGDTQSEYALALHFNLAPDSLREAMMKRLLQRVQDYHGHISTGIQATNRMMLELSRMGQDETAYALLNNRTIPSWGYTVDNGATTIWERWDGWVKDRGYQNPGMNSFNHYAIGAVGEWMIRSILGINPDPKSPAYKHFLLHPRPGGGLSFAKGSYQSIRGTIEVDWKIQDGFLDFQITVPPNTSATVMIPSSDPANIQESGTLLEHAEGIHFSRNEDRCAVIEAQAGTYRFRSPYSVK